MTNELLGRLACPVSGQALRVLDAEGVGALNDRIASGDLLRRGGDVATDGIDGGLVTADGEYVYPIRSGLPFLLPDDALRV